MPDMEQNSRNKPPATEEELARRKKSKQLAKKMVLILAISCVVLVGLDLLSKVDFSPIIDALKGEETSSIKFEYADFEEDILKDSKYLGKNRLMPTSTGDR